MSWVSLYNEYPYKGTELTAKQKENASRTIYRQYLRAKPNGAKILLLDIETAPLRAFVWRLWQQNVHPLNGQLQSSSFIITWAAKWLFDEKMMSDKLTPEEALKEDDLRITKSIWELMDEADIVIAHHGSKFDIKYLNTRFFIHSLNLPSPYRVIDTKYHASRTFLFPSNKLDYLGQILGVGRKIDTDFKLWEDCLKGDPSALDTMLRYNEQDVKLLEDVYLKMRPYITSHPNIGIYITDTPSCPVCASVKLETKGRYVTQHNIYAAFRCTDCGATGKLKTK